MCKQDIPIIFCDDCYHLKIKLEENKIKIKIQRFTPHFLFLLSSFSLKQLKFQGTSVSLLLSCFFCFISYGSHFYRVLNFILHQTIKLIKLNSLVNLVINNSLFTYGVSRRRQGRLKFCKLSLFLFGCRKVNFLFVASFFSANKSPTTNQFSTNFELLRLSKLGSNWLPQNSTEIRSFEKIMLTVTSQ